MELSKALTVLLYPFIPTISKKAAKMMGFEIESLSQLSQKTKFSINNPSILIEKIDIKKVKAKYDSLKKTSPKNEEYASLNDFKKIKLIIGKIESAEALSDKLFKLKVMADKERTIISGIRKWYKKEELEGKKVVLISNLAPKKIMGIESEGMILAAESDGKLSLIKPDKDVKEGSELS
jgi:methionyl-tRNA synthetase